MRTNGMDLIRYNIEKAVLEQLNAVFRTSILVAVKAFPVDWWEQRSVFGD